MKHIIIGNGPAGIVAAETIRKRSPYDQIVIIGAEPEPPYSRMAIPYLLIGNILESGTYLRKDPEHFKKLQIELLQGRVISVHPDQKKIKVDINHKQEELAYDKLLISTGSTPIRPPIEGMDLPGVYSCWTLQDARQIHEKTTKGTRVLQMGAGFIGCIILEALASKDIELTVVEMENRMVPRMMTQTGGQLIKKWVESKGVKVFTQTKVEKITQDGQALKVSLSNGKSLEVDTIISATGIKANIDFLKGSGIHCEKGIFVDEYMKTSIPDIYAAGDVTESIDFSTGHRMINAIQPNAADQATIAAVNMSGGIANTTGSFQVNVLDTLGLISSSFGLWAGIEGGEHAELVDEANYKYLHLEFSDDVLVGATSLGMTDHIGAMRGLIQTKVKLGHWKDKLLVDPTMIMQAYLEKGQEQASWKS